MGPKSNRESEQTLPGNLFAERFVLGEKLAEGGMSTVYQARDIMLDRGVALKLLAVDQGGVNEGFLHRFQDEARAGSRLSHPNIVQILNFGVSSGQPYIAMELVEGRTLQEVFAQDGPLNRERIKNTFTGVLDALVYAHEQHIIHRDLKPANIMISDEPGESAVSKILDFGVAKIIDSESKSESRLTIGFTGSPQYMSPEQCAGRKADQRSDIYSLACVMYEAIAQKPPFSGETPFEVMYEHLNASLPKLETLSTSLNIPRRLVGLIFQALSKDPAARPQSMKEFRDLFLTAIDSKDLLNGATKKKMSSLVVLVSLFFAIGLFTFLLNLSHPKSKSSSDQYLAANPPRKIRRLNGNFTDLAIEQQLRVLLEKRDFTSALELAQTNLRKSSKDDVKAYRNALYFLYLVYQAMGRIDLADAYLLKIIALFPSPNAEARLECISLRSELYWKNHEYSKAMQIRQMAIDAAEAELGETERHSRVGSLYLGLADYLRELKRVDESIAMYKRALYHFDGRGRRSSEAVKASWRLFDYYMAKGKSLEANEQILLTRDALLSGFHELTPDTIDNFARRSAANTFDAVTKDLASGTHHSAADAISNFAEELESRGFYTDAAKFYDLSMRETGDLNTEERKNMVDRNTPRLSRVRSKTASGVKDLHKL